MTYRLLAGAAVLALLPTTAFAQDHDHGSAPAATEAAEPAQPDHSAMDHGSMDHGSMDHAAMHPAAADADHSAHAMTMAGEGSGTSRLPANEAMSHGAMIGLGGDASLMLHGFVWPVYTDQSGPRGDDKFYVQTMGMATVTAPFEGGKLTLRSMMSLEPLMRHDGYSSTAARSASPLSARAPSCTGRARAIIPKHRSPTTGSIRRTSLTAS
jgi:hypothetical protein